MYPREPCGCPFWRPHWSEEASVNLLCGLWEVSEVLVCQGRTSLRGWVGAPDARLVFASSYVEGMMFAEARRVVGVDAGERMREVVESL